MGRSKRLGLGLAAVAVGAALAVTSCTTHKQDPSPVVGADDKPTPSPPSPTPSFTPPSAASLPTHAFLASEMPRLGESVAMAKGYTGKAFLGRLSKTWGVPLGAPKEEEFPGDRKKTVVTGDNGKGLFLQMTVTKSDELVFLDCIAGKGNAQASAFLRDCSTIDAPGADRDKVADWFDPAKKEADDLYQKRKEATVSGIFSTGKIVMFVNRLSDSEHLKIFGGAVAENY